MIAVLAWTSFYFYLEIASFLESGDLKCKFISSDANVNLLKNEKYVFKSFGGKIFDKSKPTPRHWILRVIFKFFFHGIVCNIIHCGDSYC